MPYKDPEKRRAYDREYKRRMREKARESNFKPPVQLFQEEHSEFRIKTANDILKLIADTIREVKALESKDTGEAIQQAKCIGYLAQIALRAVETSNLEGRIEALEVVLNSRKEYVV